MNVFKKISVAIFVMSLFLGMQTAGARPAEEKTIVLVHGAFADGSSWQKVIPLLKAKGYKVIAVQNPLTSVSDDVANTKRVIENQTAPVILVGHSYGGRVMTELASNPKLTALVYVAAFAPQEGENLTDLLNTAKVPAPGLSEVVADSQGFLSLTEKGVREDFAQDLSSTEQDVIYAVQKPIFGGGFTEKTTVAAWKSLPSWYVLTENDHMIPPDVQDMMSKRMSASVTRLQSSHVPMLSHPDEVAKVILEAAENTGN